MENKYLTTEMFQLNARSQFNIALFIYCGDGLVIYVKDRA